MKKNKIIELLIDMGIEFKIRNYPIELRDTILVAKYINVPAKQLFKSLLVYKSDAANPSLFMIPSDEQLNFEEIKLVPRKKVEELTGMQVGGVSPLGLIGKDIPICVSKKVKSYDWMVFSAGQRGVTLQLLVSDFFVITKASILNI